MMTGEYRRIEPSMLMMMMMVMVMFSHGRGEFVGSQEKILIKWSCLIWATSLDCGCGLKWFGIGLLSFYMGPGYVPSLGYQTSLLYMLVEWSLKFRGVTQRTYSNVSNKGIVSRILVRCFRTWRWVQIFYLILGGERKKYQPVICHHYPSFTSLVVWKSGIQGFGICIHELQEFLRVSYPQLSRYDCVTVLFWRDVYWSDWNKQRNQRVNNIMIIYICIQYTHGHAESISTRRSTRFYKS